MREEKEGTSRFCLLFEEGKILIKGYGEETPRLPSIDRIGEGILPEAEEIFRIQDDKSEFIAADVKGIAGKKLKSGLEPNQGSVLTAVELRESWRFLSEEHYRAAAKGAELLYWNRHTRYCQRCGAPLRRHTEISKICTGCGFEVFPAMAPCVIVLVTRGEGKEEEALLVHARNFRRPFFGLVAGFVETGESLEECVAREVMEETSLEIEDIRYFGSQSWPFPTQLMIGFTARWKSGEIRFADGELTEGGFFRRDSLPPLATPPSIARRLIDAWINNVEY